MNIGQTFYQGQKLTQNLSLAPQLLNWLNILQTPTTELSSMIQHELETNPALEAGVDDYDADDRFDAEDYKADGDMSEALTSFENENIDARLATLSEIDQEWREDFNSSQHEARSRFDEDDEHHRYMMDSLVASPSLYRSLMDQLGAFNLSDEQYLLAEEIIGTLDNRGYIQTSLAVMADELNTPREDLQEALAIVQQLSPSGIAARDLRECLLLQIENHDSLAYRLVHECFDLLPDKKWADAAERLNVDIDDLEDAFAEIKAIDPEPGLAVCAEPTAYVEPDVFIRIVDGEITAEVNDESIPRLSISPMIRRLLEQKDLSESDMAFIRQKVRDGQFLMRGISQRKETLLRVSKEIIRIQKDFFTNASGGDMAPLTMNKVAAIIGVHETTVSRAISNKYAATPRGLMPMKHFFKSGYRCADGSAFTPEKIKNIIDDLILKEQPATPVTDQDISDLLKEKGLTVARRTVAKYREELGLPSSKTRAAAFKKQQKKGRAKQVA